jgi:hypothetical protein
VSHALIQGLGAPNEPTHGQIVERWGSSEELGIMRQIGAVDA